MVPHQFGKGHLSFPADDHVNVGIIKQKAVREHRGMDPSQYRQDLRPGHFGDLKDLAGGGKAVRKRGHADDPRVALPQSFQKNLIMGFRTHNIQVKNGHRQSRIQEGGGDVLQSQGGDFRFSIEMRIDQQDRHRQHKKMRGFKQ